MVFRELARGCAGIVLPAVDDGLSLLIDAGPAGVLKQHEIEVVQVLGDQALCRKGKVERDVSVQPQAVRLVLEEPVRQDLVNLGVAVRIVELGMDGATLPARLRASTLRVEEGDAIDAFRGRRWLRPQAVVLVGDRGVGEAFQGRRNDLLDDVRGDLL